MGQHEDRQMRRRMEMRPVISAPASHPIRIRVGRGNTIFTSTGTLVVYGCRSTFNPTSISSGMWNSTTKAWIIADATWDNGVCYGYLDSGTVVAVALKFNSVTGRVQNYGPLTDGAIVYSGTTSRYVLGADTLTIYHVDSF